MNNPLRPSFERDLEDLLIFLKELLIVAWRFNPAQIAAYSFEEFDETINDDTPQSEKTAIAEKSLYSIEIEPAETFENDFSIRIAEVCKGLSSEIIKSAVMEYPQIEDFLIAKIGTEDAQVEEAFKRMVLSTIIKQRGLYNQLHTHLAQLREYWPRYSAIMNKSGLLDGVIGVTARLFGGPVGAVGVKAWENWCDSGDDEFRDKFVNAGEQFEQACNQYTSEVEEKLSVIFDRLTDETRRVHHLIFDCYDELAASGLDIAPLHDRYRSPDEPLDDDTREIFELALSNLEENRSIHFRTIQNIREISGLTMDSTSSANHVDSSPTLKEMNSDKGESITSQALPKESEITVKFIEDVIGRFSCDDFYLGEEAPAKKINGAIESYAPQITPKMVLLLYDDTVFGSAKEGFLLTPSNIHWRNTGEGPKAMKFTSIEEMTVKESCSIFKLAELQLNGETVDVNGSSVKERNQIAQHLLKIIEATRRMERNG